MAFIPLPDGIRISFNFLLGGVPVSINITVLAPGAVDQQAVDNAAAIGKFWWDNNGYLIFSQDLGITEVVATDVSQQPAVQGRETTFTHQFGSQAVAAVANNVALVVSLRTGFIGRSYRGRIYLPGLAKDAVVGSLLTPQAQADITTHIGALATQLTNANFTWVVASYQFNGVPRLVAAGTPILTRIVSNRVDTQRRRLPKE